MAAVLTNEPDWTALPAETASVIRALLRRCLRKDPARRMHDSADARIEIEEAIAEPVPQPQASSAPARPTAQSRAGWWAAALLVIALLATGALLVTRAGSVWSASPGPQVTRVELNMPLGVEGNDASSPSIAISPDGTQVAFIGMVGGLRRIYLRRIGEFESVALRGTESANFVSFAPDGAALVFDDPGVEVRRARDRYRPAGASRLTTELFAAIEDATKKHYNVDVLPTMSTGASDKAQIRSKGVQCYAIGPLIDAEDGARGAHSDQERILESGLYRFVRFQYDVVMSVAGEIGSVSRPVTFVDGGRATFAAWTRTRARSRTRR
jgi:hypothetical protein